MNPLNLIPAPYRLLGEAVLVGLLVLAGTWALLSYGQRRFDAGDAVGYSRGHQEALEVQGRWDAEKISQQHVALLETELRRKQDAATAEKQQEALDAQVKRAADLAAQLDHLRRERGGLQQRAAAVAAAALGGLREDDPAAAQQRQAVAALRDAVGQCSAAFVDLAAAADADRSAGLACEQHYDALTSEEVTPAGNPEGRVPGDAVTVPSQL